MATIKSFTSLEQSKKLAEILPLESADMVYTITNGYHTPWIRIEKIDELYKDDFLCWSLAALLNRLPFPILYMEMVAGMILWCCECHFIETDEVVKIEHCDNPVDACVAMVERLHELKML